MAIKKTTNSKVTKIKETDTTITFKANRRLDENEFKLLSDLIKSEEIKTGVKIILMPYSCDLN